MPRKKNIDAKDIDLINVLQRNAGISNQALAKEVGLSAGPTLMRVRALYEKGAISRPQCQLNHKFFGFGFSCKVEIVVADTDAIDLQGKLCEQNWCIEVIRLKRQTPELSTSVNFTCNYIAPTRKEFITYMSDFLLDIPYKIDFKVYDIEEVIKKATPVILDQRAIS
jgi:DNA-binding Lrp family transcriptional regulator